MMKARLQSLCPSICAALFAAACGGSLGGNPETQQKKDSPAGASSLPALSISLTDAPVEDAQNVFVTIASVAILKADGSWLDLSMQAEAEIDLLKLQDGSAITLATAAKLDPGSYSQTRLVLSESSPARLIDAEGVEHALKIPSGSESGLKIMTPLVIEAGKAAAFTIDFDLRKSLKLTKNAGTNGNGNGNGSDKGKADKYMLKPVLRMIEDSKAARIEAKAESGAIVCVYPSGTPKDNDDSCENALSSAAVKGGALKLGFLPAGTYDLRVFRKGMIAGDISGSVVTEGQTLTLAHLP